MNAAPADVAHRSDIHEPCDAASQAYDPAALVGAMLAAGSAAAVATPNDGDSGIGSGGGGNARGDEGRACEDGAADSLGPPPDDEFETAFGELGAALEGASQLRKRGSRPLAAFQHAAKNIVRALGVMGALAQMKGMDEEAKVRCVCECV